MWLTKPGTKQGISIERYRGNDLLQIVHIPIGIDVILKTHVLTFPPIIGLVTRRILIECGGTYYGPFEHSKADEVTAKLNARIEDQFYIAKYAEDAVKEHVVSMTDDKNNFGLEIVDIRVLESPQEDQKIDFLSDIELREFFLNSLDVKSREQLGKLRTLFASVENQILSPDREQRISRLLRNVEHQDATLRQIAYFVLETPDFREKIMEKIVSERMDLVMKYVPEGSITPSNITIEAEREMPSQPEVPAVFESDPQLESRIVEQKTQLMRLSRKYEKTLERLEIADDLDELKKRLKKAKNENEALNKVRTAAQTKLDEVRAEVNKEAALIAKTIDRSFLDLVLRTVGDSEYEEVQRPVFNAALLMQESRPQRIINRVFEVMQKAERTLPGDETANRNEIANYLICLTQGFITTFAGDPGTGKTSLCHLLARALGLARDDEDKRFVEVSVERGWTSHKDFIGYYNPLSNSMEISNREVFSALKLLDTETNMKPELAAPFVMLLDEANLSPIEHYWAAFLRICDFDSASERSLNMGGHTILHIPNHLRFLATVNFDHTTEELSPRFLDRSWIITLSPEVINTNTAPLTDFGNSKVVSFESLLKAFAPREQKIDQTILDEWNAVQTIFSENKLPIFPRNLRMVRNYFRVASYCMDTVREETRFAPLDFAIAQKILPTINGTGEKYRNLVEKLLERCSGKLPLCTQHLSRIKEAADNNLGFYQFFTK
jgi:hypothetical protein